MVIDGEAVWPDGESVSGGWFIHPLPSPPVGEERVSCGPASPDTSPILPRWHEPLIPRADWERLQAMLPTFAVVRSKPRSSWLEGLILHTCGQRMYLITTTPTVRRGELPMFRCANRYKPERCRLPHAEASAKNVEAAARAAFLADRRAVRSVAEVWAALRSDDARSRVESRRAIIAKKRAAVETRRSNAEEMRLSGRRSYAWWAERDAAYAAELATLAAEEAALPDTIDRPTVERLAAALGEVDDRIPNDEIALAMRELGIVAVVGAGGVRMQYGEALQPFIPEPVTVRIWRSRRD
jgi:hypothetical protein